MAGSRTCDARPAARVVAELGVHYALSDDSKVEPAAETGEARPAEGVMQPS